MTLKFFAAGCQCWANPFDVLVQDTKMFYGPRVNESCMQSYRQVELAAVFGFFNSSESYSDCQN